VLLAGFALEFNGPDIAAPHLWLTQLIRGRAEGVIAGIDRRATQKQREMLIP
jgi:hypothetical protein